METIKDLKEHLKNVLESLEDYDEETELKIVNNTYWLKRGQNFICIESVGFIDLENPTDLEECEWCGDKYSKGDLLNTREYGCLCEQCKDYLETCENEKIHIIED